MNLGAWSAAHSQLDEPLVYGDPETYQRAAAWLAGCDPIEDWGCGGGAFSRYVPPEAYIGVDGSESPYVARVVDLVHYTSKCEGLLLRHVLEHEWWWKIVLDNALASFTKRACIVLFTPLVGHTHLLHREPDFGGVPVLAFSLDDLMVHFQRAAVRLTTFEVLTLEHAHFGTETVFYLAR